MLKFYVLILLLLFIPLSGCSPEPEQEEEEAYITVTAEEITFGEIQVADRLTGTLHPDSEMPVTADISERVENVLVSAGDEVQKGQLLMTLDSSDMALQEDQLRSAVATAEIRYEEAADTYERNSRLYEAGAISFQQYESSRVQRESARLSLQEARSSLNQLQNRKGNTSITAPMSGIIENLEVKAGQFASPGTPLANIIDIDVIIARFQLSESQVGQVREGQEVDVYVRAVAAEPFSASVSRISSRADAATGNFHVEVELDNRERTLKAGMTAVVQIVQEKVTDELLVPEDAIRYTETENYIYLHREGKAERIPVEVLLSDGTYTAVRGEISEGDRVIVLGMEQLSDGDTVRVVDREV